MMLLVAASPSAAESVTDWRSEVTAASVRFGIPVAWIERVLQAESRGRTTWQGRPTISRAGAMGLMQLMPATWAEMRGRYQLGPDPYDPHDNIIAGAAYLRLMYDRFGYPGLFAAYNAGPGRYAEFLGGRALPSETQAYLSQVVGAADTAPQRTRTPPRDRLFATVGDVVTASAALPTAPPPSSLFAVPPRQ
ncbi:lytic transglycosylase domain-containing protein [Sphingomonas sp. UYP23]